MTNALAALKLELEREEALLTPVPFPTVRVMVGAPPEPPSVQVERFLLDCDINLWAGHGGSAKTVTALVTSVCVALGRPVFGTLEVRRPGVVLLILPEDGQGAARMMLDAIATGMALTPHEQSLLEERLVMVSDESLVNITIDAGRLRDTALAHGAVLVVIDPLQNVLGGANDNDNDVAACLDAIRRQVCRGARAGVLLLHHNRKPGKESGTDTAPSAHDARGGGGWVNGSRLVFNIGKRDTRLTFTATKANRMRADLRHECDLHITAATDNAAHWLSCTITDANAGATSHTLTAAVGRAINANERKALEAIDDRLEPGSRFSNSRWHSESGITSRDTFRGVKDRLLEAGLVVAEPTGRMNPNGRSQVYQYGITDRGRAALNTGWVHERAIRGEGVSEGCGRGEEGVSHPPYPLQGKGVTGAQQPSGAHPSPLEAA